MWRSTWLWRWIWWGELWYVTNKTSLGACTFFPSHYKLVIIFVCDIPSRDKTLDTTTSCNNLGFFVVGALQTVEGACSRRHVLLEVRMQKKGSSPGRSASTLKVKVTCVEHPSSVHAGWSLLPTVCKMTPRYGTFCFCLIYAVLVVSFLNNVTNHTCRSLTKCWISLQHNHFFMFGDHSVFKLQ